MCNINTSKPALGGCSFAAWKVRGGTCTLYNEPFANYISHCQQLCGPPDISGCSVDHPEENSCDGIRDGECVPHGVPQETTGSIGGWEDCANVCLGYSSWCRSWSYRDEPSRQCFLYDNAGRDCTTSYTPSGIDPHSCTGCDYCPPPFPVCGHGGEDDLCGCDSDADCDPARHICDLAAHECSPPPGKILIDSIKIYTYDCNGCSEAGEGIVVNLIGEKNGANMEGVPCQTNKLDHVGSTDFGTGTATEFNGRNSNGQEDQDEIKMMGFCYEGALNAQINGGNITWEGEGTWVPKKVGGICVDWSDEMSFVSTCDFEQRGQFEWGLVNCDALYPETPCP